MKKNFTINMYGQLYAIDEDAYQMLECYLDSMKSYFSRQEGGEEISDDIEHRVAELLWERKENGGDIVDVEIVKTIIKQIGNPSEIDDAAENGGEEMLDNASAAGKANTSAKGEENGGVRRFYRDENDKILGGVCAGIAQYFGGQDPLLWRIVICALAFFSLGITLVLYLLVWLIAPVARTPEDRLRMKGIEVNEENLREQILADSTEKEASDHRALGGPARVILWVVMIILLGLIIFPQLLTTVGIVLPFYIGFGHVLPAGTHRYLFFWVSVLLAIAIPIYGLVRLFWKNPEKKMSYGAKVALTLVWIFSLVSCFVSFALYKS